MSASVQSDRIFAVLRSDILACRLPPASRLRIPSLCARLGSSPGAVREALSRLMSEGLVRTEAQKGFTVAPVSLKDLHDLTAARIALECICLEQALPRGDVEWETQIVAAFHRLGRIEPRMPENPMELSAQWSDAHAIFHAALVAACSNGVLLRLRGMLYQESERYRFWYLPLTRGGMDRDVHAEHAALRDAALARDVPGIQQMIARHFQRTADLLSGAASDPPATGSPAAAPPVAEAVAVEPGAVKPGAIEPDAVAPGGRRRRSAAAH